MKTGAAKYQFLPHKQLLMAGSPATLTHPQRRAAYVHKGTEGTILSSDSSPESGR